MSLMGVISHKSEATARKKEIPWVLLILRLSKELVVVFPSILEMKLCYQILVFFLSTVFIMPFPSLT